MNEVLHDHCLFEEDGYGLYRHFDEVQTSLDQIEAELEKADQIIEDISVLIVLLSHKGQEVSDELKQKIRDSEQILTPLRDKKNNLQTDFETARDTINAHTHVVEPETIGRRGEVRGNAGQDSISQEAAAALSRDFSRFVESLADDPDFYLHMKEDAVLFMSRPKRFTVRDPALIWVEHTSGPDGVRVSAIQVNPTLMRVMLDHANEPSVKHFLGGVLMKEIGIVRLIRESPQLFEVYLEVQNRIAAFLRSLPADSQLEVRSDSDLYRALRIWMATWLHREYLTQKDTFDYWRRKNFLRDENFQQLAQHSDITIRSYFSRHTGWVEQSQEDEYLAKLRFVTGFTRHVQLFSPFKRWALKTISDMEIGIDHKRKAQGVPSAGGKFGDYTGQIMDFLVDPSYYDVTVAQLPDLSRSETRVSRDAVEVLAAEFMHKKLNAEVVRGELKGAFELGIPAADLSDQVRTEARGRFQDHRAELLRQRGHLSSWLVEAAIAHHVNPVALTNMFGGSYAMPFLSYGQYDADVSDLARRVNAIVWAMEFAETTPEFSEEAAKRAEELYQAIKTELERGSVAGFPIPEWLLSLEGQDRTEAFQALIEAIRNAVLNHPNLEHVLLGASSDRAVHHELRKAFGRAGNKDFGFTDEILICDLSRLTDLYPPDILGIGTDGAALNPGAISFSLYRFGNGMEIRSRGDTKLGAKFFIAMLAALALREQVDDLIVFRNGTAYVKNEDALNVFALALHMLTQEAEAEIARRRAA